MDERSIFERALDYEDDPAREAFLNGACGGDEDLRKQVELLLSAHTRECRVLDDRFLPKIETNEFATQLDIPKDPIGPFRIREKIGEGGMGVVYVAEQTEPVQRKVALKIIKPGMDTKEVIARFEAERQALAFMEHPNIARVLDAGATESGRSYFVMELVRGIPITEYCDQAKLSPRERLELFNTVCDAVQHAHQKGIIHRDIKPSNVLVTQVGSKPVVKVIDFGLAKAISGQKLTEKTLYSGFMKLMGTPVYMSPEQAGLSGLDVDTRSDVYSLGILLYELLTGTTPLNKTEIQQHAYDELCRQIREVDAPKPSARVSTLKDAERSTIAEQRQVEPKALRKLLDGDLDLVVLKALEKDRDRRYESPKELAADVDRILDDRPVLAVSPSPLYVTRKYLRRHKAVILTAATILTLLISTAAFSTWQAIRATRYGKESNAAKQEAITAKNAAENAILDVERTSTQRRRELYVANMQLAAQIWSRPGGNQREIEELLAAWIPVDEQEDDLREFTWRYQWSLLHQNARLSVFEDTTSTTFSQDGNLITAGPNGIRIWNESGRLIGHPYDQDAANAVLSSNGHWAVIPSEQVIQLIDVSSGKVSHQLPGEQYSMSSDSKFLACWQSEGEIAVWDIEANPPIRVAPLRPTDFATLPRQGHLLLSPDGKSFLRRGHPTISYRKNTVSAFLDGRSTPTFLENGVRIGSWAWSADGQRNAVGILMGAVYLQHVSQPERRILFGSHGKLITALAFSPNGRLLASGGSDGTIEIWDLSGDLNPLAPGSNQRTRETRTPIALAPGDSGDALKRLGTRRVSTAPIRSIKAHVEAITSISFSPDGTKIASTDELGTTKLWDRDDKEAIQVEHLAENHYAGTLGIFPEIVAGAVMVEDVAPDLPADASGRIKKGDRIVGFADGDSDMKSAGDMRPQQLWDVLYQGQPGSAVRLELASRDNERSIVKLTRAKMAPGVSTVAFAPDAKSLAIADLRFGATVLDVVNNRARRFPYRCMSVAYSPTDNSWPWTPSIRLRSGI